MNPINAIDQPSSQTDSLTKLSSLLTFALFASTANVHAAQYSRPAISILFEPDDISSFTRSDVGPSPSISNTVGLRPSIIELTALLSNALAKYGLHPDRSSITGDGSRLLQFFSEPTVEAGVDIFPNGDVVVIIRKNGVTTIYETAPNDFEKVPLLLKNAGVAP
jgi:hypothetical protein